MSEKLNYYLMEGERDAARKDRDYWKMIAEQRGEALDTACIKDQEQKSRLDSIDALATKVITERDQLAYRLDAIRALLKDDEVGEWKELMALVNGTVVEKGSIKS